MSRTMPMRAMWAAGLLAAGLGVGCDGRASKLVPEAGAPSDADARPDSADSSARDADPDPVARDGVAWPDLPLDIMGRDLYLPADDAELAVDASAYDVGHDSPFVSGAEVNLDVGQDSPLISGVDVSPGPGTDGAVDAKGDDCPSGAPYVVLLSGFGEGSLYRFHPDTGALVRVATVSCGSPAVELNSLTASTFGPIYVSNLDGELCVVDPSTFASSPTSFDAAAVGNIPYGMALLPQSASAGQVLYLALRGAGKADELVRVDVAAFEKTIVGPLGVRQDASTHPYSDVELTGGARGQLYGFAATATPPVLLTIDPETGLASVMAEVPVGTAGGFALVQWHGTLYLFFAEAGVRSSTVYTYRAGDVGLSRVGTIDIAVIGAGVTACP